MPYLTTHKQQLPEQGRIQGGGSPSAPPSPLGLRKNEEKGIKGEGKEEKEGEKEKGKNGETWGKRREGTKVKF